MAARSFRSRMARGRRDPREAGDRILTQPSRLGSWAISAALRCAHGTRRGRPVLVKPGGLFCAGPPILKLASTGSIEQVDAEAQRVAAPSQIRVAPLAAALEHFGHVG